ncbi:hypothetical protein PUNSTDRAFT_133838 [Punctularia strigosozonata HHB-11173 SS5]|uniref:uncharacterized protein n=1 Tax=Punctularia strigosozonata (strain HHB-11173) TaxID=741275 RepID=UPI0004418631|nr:uncharacterized protein PUNSTDRAFT_133838 [Punctularia strigosozonata HHB-11173 SS5]EIN10072.1 hypothetical protein PUNSTDRAFT_133838 [Punctularia strigosozonata HHB-11173 SS5]
MSESLNGTLGSLFVGCMVASALFDQLSSSLDRLEVLIFCTSPAGAATVQTCRYYRRGHCSDKPWFRGMIYFLWSLDALQLAFTAHSLYIISVSQFGNFLALLTPPWSLCAQVFVTEVSTMIVRCIYIVRLWVLSQKNVALVIIIISTTFWAFISGCLFGAKALNLESWSGLHGPGVAWDLYSGFASCVVADVVLAASLCYYLNHSRTGLRSTNTLVDLLMKYIIGTGALTAMCALAVLITFAAFPHNFVFAAFYINLSKLFTNALLVSLNGRERIRDRSRESREIGSMSLARFAPNPNLPTDTIRTSKTSSSFSIMQLKHQDPVANVPERNSADIFQPQGAYVYPYHTAGSSNPSLPISRLDLAKIAQSRSLAKYKLSPVPGQLAVYSG